jgi:hypothetical protein
MRMRSALIAIPVVVSALVTAVLPAGASPAGPGRLAGPPPAGPTLALVTQAGMPGLPGLPVAGPEGRAAAPILEDVFNGDSCTKQPDNPAIKSTCVAVGFFSGVFSVNGLLEFSNNGQWFGNIFRGLQTVTDPIEVSCVPQPSTNAVCVAVGEHYANPDFPVQLVATGGVNGFSPVRVGNPTGANWSALGDVSCLRSTFCMLVGAAGTARQTPRGLVFTEHATAYRWNGTALRQPAVPAPAHARASDLAGVSCATATTCMAVGNYTSATGRFLPYSALWTSGAWHVLATPTIRGWADTIFQAVSCVRAAGCVAVGDAVTPGFTALAERYAGGRWTVQRIASEPLSAFFSVSCPVASHCVAAGEHGTRSLIEAWNGTRWTVQPVPGTGVPLTTNAIGHVSCVTPAICTAVGYRHNPAVRFSYQTLALGWNGSRWTIQKTINE